MGPSFPGNIILAWIYNKNGKLNSCTKKFKFIEETKSSTWRELEAKDVFFTINEKVDEKQLPKMPHRQLLHI